MQIDKIVKGSKMRNKKNGFKPSQKVLCAMSGGVDSSVAAALLKKQGYFVVGVFMKFWSDDLNGARNHSLIRANKGMASKGLKGLSEGLNRENKCCSGNAYEAAKAVCAKLDIPLYALDCAKQFKKEIVDYFISEYKAGRTPNPCVQCNEKIKFKLLLEAANKWGIDYVATGHYARKREVKSQKSKVKSTNQNSKQKKLEIGNWKLKIARDSAKDQSYFLYNLTQRQMRRILFSLGDYTKTQVRALAKKWQLPTATRPESFEVCFVPDKRTTDFLVRHIKAKPGKIVDEKGRHLGEHRGLPFYTIGQRHGINIGGTGPYYVVGKNPRKNELIVTDNPRSPLLYRKELIVKKVNWISGILPKFPFQCRAKIRYRQPAQLCRLEKLKIQNSKLKTIKVIFNKPQRAITSGQSAVFYKGQEVLGGGVIT